MMLLMMLILMMSVAIQDTYSSSEHFQYLKGKFNAVLTGIIF